VMSFDGFLYLIDGRSGCAHTGVRGGGVLAATRFVSWL
jgi:hypothetical protein